eukprot:scaffold354_cov116-Isochrysis_galbana.AAC.15
MAAPTTAIEAKSATPKATRPAASSVGLVASHVSRTFALDERARSRCRTSAGKEYKISPLSDAHTATPGSPASALNPALTVRSEAVRRCFGSDRDLLADNNSIAPTTLSGGGENFIRPTSLANEGRSAIM